MTDKMTAEQALGLLCSAIRCGEDFHEHCERASEIIRQALTAPRVPDVDEVARTLIAAWQKAEPDHPVSKHPVSFVATFADMARAVIPMLTAAPAPADSMQLGEHVADEIFFSVPGYSIEDRIIVPAGEAAIHIVGNKITRINKLYRQKLGAPAKPAQDELATLRERVKVLELTADLAAHDIDNIALILRGETDLQKLCRGIAERLRDGEGR
jgi:hypothetical protein